MIRDRTAIVGIGQTAFAKALPGTELELACEAIAAALDDAGIAPEEVDALTSFTFEETPEFEIARNLGLGDLHFFAQCPYGGGAMCGAVGYLAMAIGSGVARTGVVWRSRKRSDPRTRLWSKVEQRVEDHWKWSRPAGLVRPVDEAAIFARRYMHQYKVSREQLAAVALTFREYANQNPAAVMHDRRMTLDDYLHARMISDPLCLYDNCLETDGAVALVITSADRAQDLRHPPVYIHAFSQGLARQHQLMTDFHGPDPLWSSSHVTARNLWRQSDIQPADIDVAQIYDAFSPLVLFSLEAFGFCGPGEAAAFAAAGELRASGSLPTNTSGGSLSEGYVHGMNLLTEAVRQLRGEAVSQIPDVASALVTSCDITPNGALVLRNQGPLQREKGG